VFVLQAPEHRDQQIDRENPDQNHLPEPQITRPIMIGCNVRVGREEFLPVFENVQSGKYNDNKTDAEKNPQRHYGFGVGMNCGEDRIHL